MITTLIRYFLLWTVALFVSIPAFAAAPKMAINIDGKLDDSAWQHARAIEAFKTLDGKTPQAATTGKMLTDETYLYLAFECIEPEMEKLQTITLPRDGEPWRNDCLDIFIAPFSDPTTYYQIIVDARGQVYDAINKGGSQSINYDVSITAKTQIHSDRWIVEIAIPLSNLGLNAAQDALMNFGRERKPVIEVTSWHGLFAKPDTWQRVPLSLSKERSVIVGDWSFAEGSPLFGHNSANIALSSSQKTSAKVLLYAQRDRKWGLKNGRQVSLDARQEKSVTLPFEINAKDKPQALRWVIEKGNTTLFNTTYRFNLPENPLVVTLQSSYYYAQDTYAILGIQNFLSPSSIKTGVLYVTVKSPDGKVQQFKKISPLVTSMREGVDISGWKNGNGVVFVELRDGKQILAHQRLEIPKRQGPFTQ